MVSFKIIVVDSLVVVGMLVSLINFDMNSILLQTPHRFTNLENFNGYQLRMKQLSYLSYTYILSNCENPYPPGYLVQSIKKEHW